MHEPTKSPFSSDPTTCCSTRNARPCGGLLILFCYCPGWLDGSGKT